MAFGDADRAVFTSDFGSVVVLGATTGRGTLTTRVLEEPDGTGYVVRVQRPVLRVSRGTFTAPAPDTTLTVGGASYVFRGVLQKGPTATFSGTGMEDWVLAEVTP